MIRVLTMIAIAGFVLSVATLSAAVAIGGPDAIARGSWGIVEGDGNWDWHSGHGRRHGADVDWAASGDLGKETTRTMAWSGAAGLDVDLPADVRYVQQDGAATVELTGPERALQHVEIHGDSISYDHRFRGHGYPKLNIVIRAPGIHAFDVSGGNTLRIEGYRQSTIDIDASGAADVSASGEADEVSLEASGNSDVDLGGLKAKGADVEVSGSGEATLSPSERADIEVSGAGGVRLLTTPRKLSTDISGAGRLRQDGGSAAPAPPAVPATKGAKT